MKEVPRAGEMAKRIPANLNNGAVPKNGAVQKLDPRSESFTREFKRAAKAFTLKATESPEKALAVLVEAGIYTRTGRLTKNYR